MTNSSDNQPREGEQPSRHDAIGAITSAVIHPAAWLDPSVERAFGGGREDGKSMLNADVLAAMNKARAKAMIDAALVLKHHVANMREAQKRSWSGERARTMRLLARLARRIEETK